MSRLFAFIPGNGRGNGVYNQAPMISRLTGVNIFYASLFFWRHWGYYAKFLRGFISYDWDLFSNGNVRERLDNFYRQINILTEKNLK